MTSKQIEQLDDVLMLLPDNHPAKKKELQRNRARSMANSCICYGDDKHFYDEETGALGHSAEIYLDNGLTAQDLKDIYYEQKEEIAKGTIRKNVHTDHEGCTYNSICWWDENDDTAVDRVAERARRNLMNEASQMLQKAIEVATLTYQSEEYCRKSQHINLLAAMMLFIRENQMNQFPNEEWAVKFREELDEMVDYLEEKQQAA